MGTVTQLLSRSPESGASSLSAEHAQILRTYADLVVRAASLGGQVMIDDKYRLSIVPIVSKDPVAEVPLPSQPSVMISETSNNTVASYQVTPGVAKIITTQEVPIGATYSLQTATSLDADQQARLANARAAEAEARGLYEVSR